MWLHARWRAALGGLLLAAGLSTSAAAPNGPPAPGVDPQAEALAQRLDARHRRTGDLRARFIQSYRSGLLGREVIERGSVSIKRPGRMLWEYRDPERKTFVSDGTRYYFYVPADRQVIVRDQAGDQGLAALLLSGDAAILDKFEVALEPAATGVQRLRLLPRRPDAEVERVFLEVDARDRIVLLEVHDVQGNRSRFRFEDLRENTGLPDRLFRFEIPRGVEVVAG
jgi:outer membrane lipoprotein carrier protein